MRDPLGYVLGQQQRNQPSAAQLVPAVVSRSDTVGVWVTPVGGDTASPLGPCVGGLRPILTGNLSSGYALGWERLPVGTPCLVVNTSEGPFLVSS